MNEFLKCGAKRKFIVLNLEHIFEYMGYNLLTLKRILKEYYEMSLPKEKDHEYLVINTDEPYIDEVIEVLKKHGHWG